MMSSIRLLYNTDIKTQFAFMNNTSKCIRNSNSYYPLIIWRAIDTYQKAKNKKGNKHPQLVATIKSKNIHSETKR